ncbi:eCIS core domain-containing protein [Streptomyces sp. SudanB52_2052]|uniref:eCIS core domain-containing protein n=1 Tax=Streptomyces sp. SudanB52_2052 TaxID=3035276 RepID=UPI003F5796FE
MTNSRTQDGRSEQSAEQRRRKRKERAAKSRAPEPKDIVSGAGQPLDPGVRRELEERLGHDLSRVRLHTGRDAGRLTELLGADAVAVGQDVFFREGTFMPGTDEGLRLLAHELLHTVQNPHGLGALRAGRELGAVSLPQEAIEREAESAAQDLVRDPQAAAPEIEEGRGTPGWLRYATVDADRRRMEQLDPATLVDRLANTLLRSLRGDPEDRSGRVRIQLARMAPEVQDSVLDRLELRLPEPVVDRLLEAVQETEQSGPPPLDAATAPHAVPGAAEEVEEERERADSQAGNPPERDARPDEPGAGRQEGTPGDDREEAPSGEADQEKAPGGAGTPQRDASKDEQQRSQDQQEEKDASARDTRQDSADERQEASDTERAQQEQDQQDERGAEEDADGGEDEAAQEPDRQGVEQEQRQDTAVGDVARRPAASPGAVDRSGAEPGEKSRTAADPGMTRTAGDPENEQDVDDEPLGLDAESTQDGAEDERTADEEAGSGRAGDSDTEPSGPEAADVPQLFVRRRRGAPRPPDLAPSQDESFPDETTDTAEPEASRDTSGRTADDASEDRTLPELGDATTADHDAGAEAGGASHVPDAAGSDTARTSDPAAEKNWEQQRTEEQREDDEAARHDQAVRADDAAAPAPPPAPGETAQPGELAKAGEDARTQSGGSASGSGSGSGPGAAADGASRTQGSAEPEAGASDRSGGPGTSSAAGKAPDRQTGKAADATGGRDGTTGDQGTTPPALEDATGNQDVTEGKGPATVPGPATGPDKVATPGPAGAPALAPGKGPSPLASGPEPKTNTPKAAEAGGAGGAPAGPTGSRSRPSGGKRQAARQAAKTASRRGGGGSRGARPAAPVRSGGRGATGRPAATGGAKAKKEAPPPDVSNATPESGLSTAAGLKPHQALETLKGVDSAVGRSVDKERTALHKAPPTMQRPSGSPRTVPGGPKPAAPGTYTNAKVARTEAAPGKTPEITGEQKPQGEVPGANVPEPSWWDIALTIGAQLFGKLLKEILPLDDLIDSTLGLPTKDEGLQNARVGDAPRLPLENDSDPQRTDEQSRNLDQRRDELHQSGREDAARPMGEDQIYPDVPKETLTGKVAGGKKGAKAGGTRSVSGGGVPIESASAVAEHDRGPQIQAGFAQGRQRMGQERQAKDKKAADDRRQHDQDLQREVTANGKKQSDARDKGRSDIADSRDRWRKEQDDKVAEIDGKKGKKYDQVRKDIQKKEEDTDKDVDKRTEDDNKRIETEQTNAERDAEKKQEEGKDDADNWLEEAIEKLKEFFEGLKNAIKGIFEKARQVVTDLIDRFKQQVFKLIDDARNWVIDQINTFADALIALGDELLADYPAMRDKWRNTIDGARDWAVQKVNEAADALKEVAGKLLDGLCGALLAGLDVLEGGLLAAVDIAETVTVGALEFGAAAVAALGEWAAIFNDIVSDPGDWISKAGAAAETGAKEYLFEEVKTAVKAWFEQKVQEIIGIPMEDFQELVSGGVSVEQMAQMAWDEALPQLPVIIGVMVVEKVVAKLIPGAGWVMAIIDALQTAWGALSEILAAFGLFMDFLKSVKSGNGALPFAKAVAAGVVALLELIYEFLIEGVSRFMGKVAERLGDMLKNLRTKKKQPGPSDGSDQPPAPDKPRDQQPAASDDRTPAPDRRTDPADDRPTDRPAPRKPSPDKTSRPPSRPRPGKRSTPQKTNRPAPTTRPKKRRDDDERRDDGREVNAARRRARDAERRVRDEDRDGRTAGPARRGPARDTLRTDRRRPGRDRTDDRERDPLGKRPDDGRRPDERRPDRDRGDDRRRDTDRKRDDDRRPDDRSRRRRLRRARQTLKSAANRARRAARRLFGKARRRLGSRLNDRLRRLRDLWRRRRDRMRDDRSRRPGRDRRNGGTQSIDLPKVRYADADDGEHHTLMFHGRGADAGLFVHSIPEEVPRFLDDWRADIEKQEPSPEKEEQQTLVKAAAGRYNKARRIQKGIPSQVRKEDRDKYRPRERALRRKMADFAHVARLREYNDVPTPPDYPPFFDVGTGRKKAGHEAGYLGTSAKTVFGGPGQDASRARKGQPPGWGYIQSKGMSKNAAWVRMHLLPERLGGKATGNNLVPARGPQTNIDFLNNIEDAAYQDIPRREKIIWYRTRVEFNHGPDWPDFPSHIYAEYGGYEKVGGTGKKKSDWTPKGKKDEHDQPTAPPREDEENTLFINSAGRTTLTEMLDIGRTLADYIVAERNRLKGIGLKFNNPTHVYELLEDIKGAKNSRALPGLDDMFENLKELDQNGKVDWN